MKLIRGAGGGGKGGGGSAHTPVEAPDSLRARQFARGIDVVSEGEIEGLVDGLRSIYLEGVPIQNRDGTMNFQGVTIVTRNGTQSQTYAPGFSDVESENSVGVQVKQGTPVVRSISDANINAVRVTVSIPQLTVVDTSNGDTNGTSLSLAIDVQTAGGGFVNKVTDTISGKTTSRYPRAYRIELSGDGPWDIRVRRLTPDSTSQTLQNALYWDSYTEIIDAKLSYPNTAYIAWQIDAQQFQSIPSRGYEIKGIKLRVPANYDPLTRAYVGEWDGTFKLAWSNNPAWCFYDLLTNKRYGLGDFIDASQVDKWSLYQIARYCDELVDDGFGGTEPRFTCSLYLQTRQEAYTVVNTLASIFAGMAYWAGGAIVATQDAPSEPVALFTNANVVPDQSGIYFNYSGSSISARHTVALVTWNDPADKYQQKVEYVADEEGIAKYGVVQTSVVAFGCTSRGQAHRFGRRILYAERMETEMVSFSVGLDALAVAPGCVIQTSDPVRAGKRVGGRLLSANINTVVLDAPQTLEEGKIYTLWATLPDGTVQSRTVVSAPGETSELAVAPDFDDVPQRMSVYVLAAPDLIPETWRVVSITEQNSTQAQITAMSYRADKYDAIERGVVLEPLQTSALNGAQATPTNFTITEALYLVTTAVVGTRITVSWSGNASYFELQYRKQNGNWQMVTTSTSSLDIAPVDHGVYEFSLVAINAVGRRSAPRKVTQEIYGKTAPPANLTGFTVIKSTGVAIASWAQHPDLDVRVGGRVVLRHSPKLTDVNWNDGYILQEFGGDTVTGILPLVTGTYMAKARDSSGNWSASAVMFIATEGMVTGFTTVGTSIQAPDFLGAHTNVAVIGGALQLDGGVLVDDMTEPVDGWPKIDTLGGVSPTGSYEFDAIMDLGTVLTRRVEADIAAFSFDTGDFVDSRLDMVDRWDSVDGDAINDCDVTLYAATTDDAPSGEPSWKDWTPFIVSDFTFRAMKFRLDFESGASTHNIAVTGLTVHAKLPA